MSALRPGTYRVVCKNEDCGVTYEQKVTPTMTQSRVCGTCGGDARFHKLFTLNFEYCECGCKGFAASVGRKDFWMFLSLEGKANPVYLGNGHGWSGSQEIGRYANLSDAEAKANELAREHRKKIMKEMRA